MSSASTSNIFGANPPEILPAGILVDRRGVNAACEHPIWTTTTESPDHPIARLIKSADEDRNIWHIEGLWQPNTIMVVHSLEGGFKSVFAYQVGEALATASPLLRKWNVPQAVRVGVLQTEMPDNMVGQRLRGMYPGGRIPANLIVSGDELITDMRRNFKVPEKFQAIHNWIIRERIEVLVWDTINGGLSACGNPNSEEATATFYAHLQLLPHRGALVVRHDGKPSKDSEGRQGNQKIRGSNVHAEIASVVIQLTRHDKRSNQVVMEIGKLRHGAASEPMKCWFDNETMRLTFIPPPIALLEGGAMTRDALCAELIKRFSIKTRSADTEISELHKQGFLSPSTQGHQRVWSLNPTAVAEPETPQADWWSLVKKPDIAASSTYPQEICNVAVDALEPASTGLPPLQDSRGV